MFKKRLDFFRSILYTGDLFLVVACWFAAYYVRFFAPIIPVTKGVPDFRLYLTLLGLVLVVFLVVLQVTGLYRRPWAGFAQYFWPVFRAVTIGVVVSITLTYFLKPYEFSRLVFVHFYAFVIVAMILYRPLLRWAWRRFMPDGEGEAVLVVGAEDLGRMTTRRMRKHPVLGLNIKGFLAHDPKMVGKTVDGIPVLGTYLEVAKAIKQTQAHLVIIALPLEFHGQVLNVLNQIGDEMVDIKVVPDLMRHVSLGATVEVFEGLPFIGVRGTPMEGWAVVAKRATDLVGSLIGLILLSPLLAALALTVRLTSPGPILFRQQRMGLDGRLFTMYKFRSMRIDAEEDCGPVWACPEDPRRTKFGAFLRSTSLDEIPQLFNVFKGEMSLVGPRPERPEFITDFRRNIPQYMLRHKVKAGITGWAQINGWRGNTSLERRIEHDLFYIENWSLRLDLKIIALTPFRGLIDPNAY